MGRKPTEREQEEFLKYLRAGRDEMNLLEHSISSASKQIDRDTRSLVFVREVPDPDSGELVERSWRVSFSADYGRPTVVDDNIFVACIKLSAANNFASRTVEFTRYELCKILGLGISGKNFKAIDDAFNRLRGVHIVAKKCWYDNEAKSWVNRKFSVFDHVEMYDREEYLAAKRVTGQSHPRSHFVWSKVMQESFDKGYVRSLDLEVYRSLKNPIARKLFRYLGKHFYFGKEHAIDLQTLGHQKLGYQSGKPNAELKRLISPAIRELEQRGIYGLSHAFNSSYGKCQVVFSAKSTTKEQPKSKSPEHPLIERLVKFGVDRSDAQEACQRLSPQRVLEDVEHVEFEDKANRIKSSKAGMLATLLKAAEPWARPQGFVSSVERAARSKQAAEKSRQVQDRQAREDKLRLEAEEREEAAFTLFMGGMSEREQEQFQEQALASNGFIGKFYRKARQEKDQRAMSLYLTTALKAAWKETVISDNKELPKKRTRQGAVVQKSTLF